MTASKRLALAIGFVGALLILAAFVWPRRVAHDELAATSTRLASPSSVTGGVATAPRHDDAHASSAGATAPVTQPAPPVRNAGITGTDRGPEPPHGADPAPVERQAEAASPSAAQTVVPPHFDVVRVEPSGEAVIAGKAAPNATVGIVSGGKVVADTKADANGHFVILPPPLKPGDYALTLRQTMPGTPASEGPAVGQSAPGQMSVGQGSPGKGAAGETVESSQSIVVSVPKSRKEGVVVALAEPGKPTAVLARPGASPAPVGAPPSAVNSAGSNGTPPPAAMAAPGAEARLAIGSVELENGSGLYASGTAAPGTTIRLYLNDTHLADAVAGPDGHWSLTLRRGLSAGHYTVRADAIGASAGKVFSRVAVPFDVPANVATAAPTQARPVPPAPTRATETAARDLGPEPPSAPSPDETIAALALKPADVRRGEAEAAAARPGETRPDDAKAGVRMPQSEAGGSGAASSTAANPTAAPARPSASADARAGESKTLDPSASTRSPAPDSVLASSPPPPASNPSDPVVEEVATASVIRGDNLWDISRKRLGAGVRYTRIYAANASQIRDPDLIYPGQILVVPKR